MTIITTEGQWQRRGAAGMVEKSLKVGSFVWTEVICEQFHKNICPLTLNWSG